jgi:hypothetical protein
MAKVCSNSGVPPRVIARLVNQLADLHAWGKAADGWWGLITWSVHGRLDDGVLGDVQCSAWIPADELQASISPEERPGYAQLVRLELPAGSAWPTPATRGQQSWHHYGRLDHPPEPPPGLRVIGASKRRAP